MPETLLQDVSKYFDTFVTEFRRLVELHVEEELKDRAYFYHVSNYPATIYQTAGHHFAWVVHEEPSARVITRQSRPIVDLVVGAPHWSARFREDTITRSANISFNSINFEYLPQVGEGCENVCLRHVKFGFNDPETGSRWETFIPYAEFHTWDDRDWSEGAAMRRAADEAMRLIADQPKSSGDADFIVDVAGEAIVDAGFEPIRVDDHPDIPDQTLSQKVLSIALGCRFVVVVDAVPSGHLTELALLKVNGICRAIVQIREQASSFMVAGDEVHDGSAKRFYASDYTDLAAAVSEAVRWAAESQKAKGEILEDIYPWRTPDKDQPN